MNCWLVLVELIAQISVHNDPHKALRLCPLSGTNKVKSDTREFWMGNHECHSCVCSFYLGLGKNILYNSTQGCGWTVVVCDTSYSKSVLLLTTVLRKEIYKSSVSQSYTEFWPNAPKAAQAYSGLQALFSLI